LIERKHADELALDGRNWASLTAYIPSAVDTGWQYPAFCMVRRKGLDNSNFTYDGVD
jgi:hypothetical protein